MSYGDSDRGHVSILDDNSINASHHINVSSIDLFGEHHLERKSLHIVSDQYTSDFSYTHTFFNGCQVIRKQH